ncbi:MAG TPA: DNA-3-methyladenine glycosylase [Candidatus Saccharimonadales bacterium]|nr:DNA-3-methyladenine glycosylase [Candidatus Saccharimonadales bacterium]
MLNRRELETSAPIAAQRLLGCVLDRQINGRSVKVRVVETEAYDQSDAASHSYKPRSQRTDVMFGPAGYLYVYFTYGLHYCANVVVGQNGYGAAVLIRSVEPISNFELLQHNRPTAAGYNLTNGPAKFTQALGINKELNGHDLSHYPLKLILLPPINDNEIACSPRIGISQAKDIKWRFYIRNNPYVSKVRHEKVQE